MVDPPPPPATPTNADGDEPKPPGAGSDAVAGTGGGGAGVNASAELGSGTNSGAPGAGTGASAGTGGGEARPDKTRRPTRTGRSGSPPKVTLTLRFADFGWTVEALVAGRREKPQPVPLAAIRAFADQLEDQGLRRQLDSTVEACRNEAQKRATALRAELAKLETELAALDD